MEHADAHARLADKAATVGKCAFAILAVAQARLLARKEWALNEKGVVARAGLTEAERLLTRETDAVALIGEVREAIDISRVGEMP